jgi:uncharacterized protein (DUF2141 family)
MNRRLHSFTIAVAAAWLLMPLAFADTPQTTVRAEFSDVRNAQGAVACLLFNTDEGFPEAVDKAYRVVRAPISEGRAVCEFQKVTAGTYAVMAMHDENGNGKMDKNLLGIPIEGYTASNNVRHALLPPSFQEASFNAPSGVVTTIHIHMRY